jgi:calcineurin-like phosphoesterase
MVGKTGRTAVWDKLPGLVSDLKLDFVIVNGENAAGGFGITEDIYLETINAGADVVTTGNHVWDQKEAVSFCERHDQFLRPANYPDGTPGKGSGMFYARNDAIIFDFHAEATSEKQCFGHFVDGRASFVVGTHTHVPTADAQILNGGTAYMSDAGMCGDYDSSLGMEKEEPINRFISKMPKGRFEAASGPATICGVGVEISDRTGLAEKIAPLRIGPRLAETLPSFWA